MAISWRQPPQLYRYITDKAAAGYLENQKIHSSYKQREVLMDVTLVGPPLHTFWLDPPLDDIKLHQTFNPMLN